MSGFGVVGQRCDPAVTDFVCKDERVQLRCAVDPADANFKLEFSTDCGVDGLACGTDGACELPWAVEGTDCSDVGFTNASILNVQDTLVVTATACANETTLLGCTFQAGTPQETEPIWRAIRVCGTCHKADAYCEDSAGPPDNFDPATVGVNQRSGGYDTTGDGEPNIALVDRDADGNAETIVVDADGDGFGDSWVDVRKVDVTPDSLSGDTNSDGVPDAVKLDANGDGIGDAFVVDRDRDGKGDAAYRPDDPLAGVIFL